MTSGNHEYSLSWVVVRSITKGHYAVAVISRYKLGKKWRVQTEGTCSSSCMDVLADRPGASPVRLFDCCCLEWSAVQNTVFKENWLTGDKFFPKVWRKHELATKSSPYCSVVALFVKFLEDPEWTLAAGCGLLFVCNPLFGWCLMWCEDWVRIQRLLLIGTSGGLDAGGRCGWGWSTAAHCMTLGNSTAQPTVRLIAAIYAAVQRHKTWKWKRSMIILLFVSTEEHL